MTDQLQRGGSVKRARQRARAAEGFGPEHEPVPQQMARRSPAVVDRTNYPHNQFQGSQPPPNWMGSWRQHMPVGGPVLNPGPRPQRPLAAEDNQGRPRNNSPTRDQRLGPAPQRPPRPAFMPSMQPELHEPQQRHYWEDGYLPSTGREGSASGSTGPWTSSAANSIPDFPLPIMPVPFTQQPRRPANLGPPPSARKGGASYYLQNSFVAPIPEEQSESHNSMASSHVIPHSWGDGPPEYYVGAGIDEEEETAGGGSSEDSHGRQSRGSDYDDSTGLVRKVSIGRPGRPSLKTVRSGEGPERGDRSAPVGGGMNGMDGQDDRQKMSDGSGGGATFLSANSVDNSPSGTPPDASTKGQSGSAPFSPPQSHTPIDPRVQQILGGLERAGALTSSGTASPMTSTAPSMNEKEFKRPPPLVMDGERDTETRASSTSLPELIRRATRLASNLDRGRTASRLGMLNMLSERAEKAGRGSRSGSISDMLNAFPSPSVATPNGERPGSRWPSPLAKSAMDRDQTYTPTERSDYPQNPRNRKCCGMPIWAFTLICIILLLLIAAAVVIPITLIVLPRQHAAGLVTDLASCQKSVTCNNGGTNFFVAKSCRCICADGFTGATCTTAADSGCTSSDVQAGSTSYKNATVGTSILRLLSGGPSNYSIPLAAPILLSLFSNANLSCTSENALITFNKQPQRRSPVVRLGLAEIPLIETPSPSSHVTSTPTFPPSTVPTLLPRDVTVDTSTPPVTTAATNAITSNSIIFAAPTNSPNVLSSNPSSSSSLLSTSSPLSSPNSPTTISRQIFDFARVAVLFIYQEKTLDAAVAAQNGLQAVLFDRSTFNATKVGVGQGVVVDLKALTVDLGNGTLFGGGKG